MSELPIYTPSGQGGQVDLKNILVAQMLAWGTFRHQFKSKYESVAGTQIVDGIEVFNPLQVKGNLNPGDEVREFLLFIGFSDEELDSMNDDMNNSDYGMETVHLTYQVAKNYELVDFEFAVDFIIDEINTYDSISISLYKYAYIDGSDPLPRKNIQQYGIDYDTEIREKNQTDDLVESTETELWVNGRKETDTEYPYDETTTGITPNPKNFPKSMIFKIMKDGVDITSTVHREILEMIGVLALLEPTKVIPTFVSESTHDLVMKFDGVDDQLFHELRSVYEYDFSALSSDYLKTLHTSYAVMYRDIYDVNEDMTEEEKDRFMPREMISDLFWRGFGSLLENHTDYATDGLFHAKIEPISELPPFMLNYDNWDDTPLQIYMVADGIATANPETFGYYMSTFMFFDIKKDNGGWFKRFFGGLINAFLGLVDAILGIFLEIPMLKQLTEIVLSVIGKIAGVDAIGARAILKQILAMIIVAVVASFVPNLATLAPEIFSSTTAVTTTAAAATSTGLSVGLQGAVSMMISYSTHAIEIYNIVEQTKIESSVREMEMNNANADYAQVKAARLRNKVKEAFMGTLGTAEEHEQSDNMMYNIMFNPFSNHDQAVPPSEINSEHKLY